MDYTKKRKDTICWDCAKAYKKCSWSKDFKPVDGWVAEQTQVKARQEWHENRTLTSYLVIECPEFIKG